MNELKKTCSKCKCEKTLEEFYIKERGKYGHAARCKICDNIISRLYQINNKQIISDQKKEKYKKNKPEITLKNKKYYENNKEEIKENSKEYYKNNKEERLAYQKEYRIENIDIIKTTDKKRNKKYREENPEKIKDKQKKYREENPEKIKNSSKNYRKNNKSKIKESNKKYKKKKFKNDILFKLNNNIGNMIRHGLRQKKYKKLSRTIEILGCSFDDLRTHLEIQWSLPKNLNENNCIWMNWENYGKFKNGVLNYGWDIDHIIPLSSATT